MHAVIFAGGTIRPSKAIKQAIASADIVVAADKGAVTALKYGCIPHIVVGDFDSLPSTMRLMLEQKGTKIIKVAIEKDETDTELAVQTALEHAADTVTVLGSFGGTRLDHTMANIFLLAGFDASIQMIDGPTTCWILRGPDHTTIEGKTGDLLSLFPLRADACGITTTNLYYALQADTLKFGKPRGISNILTQDHATVSLEKGMLLVMHTSKHELYE